MSSFLYDLFRKSSERTKTMGELDFWELIDTIDHEYGGDSEAVISSLVRHLKNCSDEYIFTFDDKLSELIYSLDGRQWAEELFGNEPFNEEKFLSARAAAVAAGRQHYFDVLGHKCPLSGEHIHEYKGRWYGITDGLITAAADAWVRKHLQEVNNYPHETSFSLKSHSNSANW